jgi:hypothetical protein
MRRLLPEEAECILRNARLEGFGGRCACAALAINRVLFSSRAGYRVAYNRYLWEERNYWIGHVVVEDRAGRLWDSRGRISWSELEDWGRPEHLYLTFPDEESYQDVAVEKMTGRKLMTTCDPQILDDMIERLVFVASDFTAGRLMCSA